MHARRSLLLGACLLACDPRPSADTEDRDAAPVPEADPAATATTAAPPPPPTSVEDPPKPADDPVATPDGASESVVELEARAWTHYRAREYEAAGTAFAQLAEREPTIWKYPYNAACAAAMRQDYAAAQLALVRAFQRGGDAARTKAKQDSDLASLRARSWWSELLAADEAQLDAWQLHDEDLPPPPEDRPSADTPIVTRLTPYGPGEAPVEVSVIKAAIEEPSGSSSWRLRTTLNVDKRKPWTGGAWLLTTCEADGRYFAANKKLEISDGILPVGHTRDFEVQTFAQVFTNDAPAFKRCELRLVHVPAPDADGRLLDEACYTGTRIEPGRCPDFQRAPATKLEARMTTKFSVDTRRKAVWVYVELGAGLGPRPDERYHVSYNCQVEGNQKTGALALLTPGRYDLLAPGEVIQGSITIFADAVPDQCELVVERTCCDQGKDTGIGPYCATATGQVPGPCAWD